MLITGSFANAVMGRTIPTEELYTGKGEEDAIDDLDVTDVIQMNDEEIDLEMCPVVDFLWDFCKSLSQPWQRALIIRVIGKTFNFKILEPRVKKMWQLSKGCELVNL